MDKDYSSYKPTEYEKYRWLRANNKYVTLDINTNFALFPRDNRTVQIQVNYKYEFVNMYYWIEDGGTEEQLNRFVSEHTPKEEDSKEYLENKIAKQKQSLAAFESRYKIESRHFEDYVETFYEEHPEITREPLHNILSGCNITMPLGEGILDFVYADFDSAYKDTALIYGLIYQLREEYVKNNKDKQTEERKEFPPEKIENQLDERIHNYYEYYFSCDDTRGITEVSLYTAICPPVIKRSADTYLSIKRYYQYLKALQKEYLDILQFCFDEDYYPELLGNMTPAERYYTFRMAKDFPPFIERNEELYMAFAPLMDEKTHTYDFVATVAQLKTEYPAEPLGRLAAELNTSADTLSHCLRRTHRLTRRYSFSSTEEMLELELSKMIENDIRFRKCKRCGRYFIMKGNYDTRFCDRIVEGETRSCQELAAQENYKKKMAENVALPIYSKYYKRYAARVKVNQIKKNDFKKWKYEALVKRDECSAGNITPEEYIDWLEGCFPNRKRKDK